MLRSASMSHREEGQSISLRIRRPKISPTLPIKRDNQSLHVFVFSSVKWEYWTSWHVISLLIQKPQHSVRKPWPDPIAPKTLYNAFPCCINLIFSLNEIELHAIECALVLSGFFLPQNGSHLLKVDIATFFHCWFCAKIYMFGIIRESLKKLLQLLPFSTYTLPVF